MKCPVWLEQIIVYGPVFYGPVAVDGGTVAYWIENMQTFAQSSESLTSQFPQGGLMLTGMGKVFGCTGIALALYSVAKQENKKMVMGLVLGAAITAILTGITEPIEFTFLFIAPALFALHAVLSATMATIAFTLGVSGNFQTGLIDFIFQNWLPLAGNHAGTYAIQILVGLTFTAIYFVTFRTLILKYNILTPGREGADTKLYSKADYKEGKQSVNQNIVKTQASAFIEGLGGKDNIELLTNCATRLRVKVKDAGLVKENAYFTSHGAVNVVRNKESFQIIVGLTVPQVREDMSQLIKV